jgi:hypothetical protein
MKNRLMNVLILSAVALSTFSTITPQEANPSTWQKVKNFADRNRSKILTTDPAMWTKITAFAQQHKKKIIAGGIAVIVAALGASAAAYVHKRAENAIQKAGIDITKKYHQDYKEARELITHYGVFGPQTGINLLKSNKDENAISYIATSNVGDALGIFWGMNQFQLATALGHKGLVKQY